MRNLIPPLLFIMMLVLVASGLMRYCFAFSITATSFHMMSAFFVVLITIVHVGHHARPLLKHVKKIIESPMKVIVISAFSIGLVWSVVEEAGPARWLMESSYESRFKEDIFRPHHQVVSQTIHSKTQVHRKADGVNLLINCELNKIKNCVIAIWAESNGDMIEPLYLSPSVAYSKELEFQNHTIRRDHLLPVFFDGYSRLQDRLRDDGLEVDGVSTATIVGSFNLDSVFESRLKQFSIIVEVNEIGDENKNFTSRDSALISKMPDGVGVPSLLYQADIDLYEDTKYYLMERLGRSDNEDDQVSLIYDTEGMVSALELVEKVLVKVMKTGGDES